MERKSIHNPEQNLHFDKQNIFKNYFSCNLSKDAQLRFEEQQFSDKLLFFTRERLSKRTSVSKMGQILFGQYESTDFKKQIVTAIKAKQFHTMRSNISCKCKKKSRQIQPQPSKTPKLHQHQPTFVKTLKAKRKLSSSHCPRAVTGGLLCDKQIHANKLYNIKTMLLRVRPISAIEKYSSLRNYDSTKLGTQPSINKNIKKLQCQYPQPWEIEEDVANYF